MTKGDSARRPAKLNYGNQLASIAPMAALSPPPPGQTTVTVGHATLSYFNRVRGLLEYHIGTRLSNDEALRIFCMVAEYGLTQSQLAEPEEESKWLTHRLTHQLAFGIPLTPERRAEREAFIQSMMDLLAKMWPE